MADSTSLVRVIITGDPAQCVAAMKSAADSTEATSAKISGSSTSMGQKVGGALSKMGEVSAFAIAGVAVAAVHLADEMGKATNQIAANAGISQAAAKKIGDAFQIGRASCRERV